MILRALVALAVLLWGGALVRDTGADWVAATQMPSLVHETSVEVRDRNGVLLRAYTVDDGRWRMALGLDRVDPLFVDMLLAYEDKRFRDHSGVDPLALLRALSQATWTREIVSGGSTLTMQVARLLEDSGTGRWSGKWRQMRVAWALEQKLSKDEILSLYLLVAPYGGNIEGLRAASLVWFGKEPQRLTPAQAALLVALPQAPESRRPDRFPETARAARDRVLHRMARAHVIDESALNAALRDPAPDHRRAMPQLAPHLADRALAEAPDLARHDLTLDASLQERAETLARNSLRGLGERVQIALIVADHPSGEILASVGSASYSDDARRQGFVDMTRALRSPGSTLKPLVYALAFDRGLAHPQTLIDDTPVDFDGYAPQNFDGIFRGQVRVERALQLSLNIPVVRLTAALGPAQLMAGLRRSGAKPELTGKPGLAVALGGVGITLEDLVQLYAGLGAQGEARGLHWRQGAWAVAQDSIVTARAAWQVGHILAGLSPPGGGPKGQIAYKTGTSYGHRDAWALGWDGRHVAGVWIGRPDGTPVPGAFGGDLAAPVLFELMQRIAARRTPLPPPPRDTLIVSGADLPQPLQVFQGRGAEAAQITLAFPPDGATLALADGLPIKLRDGVPPFTVLANGGVLVSGARSREIWVPLVERGHSVLSVIDAAGQADRVRIELR